MNHDHTHDHSHEHGTCCSHHHDAPAAVKPKKDHHKTLLWTSILAATSHIFCCVLPGVFALLALLSGFGIVATLPGWLEGLHEYMHGTEVPVLIFSGAVVAIGWLAHFYSKGHDCHDVGECHHDSCQPRKKKVSIILLVASALFIVNLIVYFGFHADYSGSASHIQEAAEEHIH